MFFGPMLFRNKLKIFFKKIRKCIFKNERHLGPLLSDNCKDIIFIYIYINHLDKLLVRQFGATASSVSKNSDIYMTNDLRDCNIFQLFASFVFSRTHKLHHLYVRPGHAVPNFLLDNSLDRMGVCLW